VPVTIKAPHHDLACGRAVVVTVAITVRRGTAAATIHPPYPSPC
jgi:hypothetical protein